MLLVCVTLSAPDDWDDHTSLYDWAFSQFQGFRINSSDTGYVTMSVISGISDMVSARPSADFFYLTRKSDELTVEIEAPRFVYAGVIRGARAGRIVVKNNGEPIAEMPLVYTENVAVDESERLTGWEKIRWAWYFANSRGGPNYGAAPAH
jgi:D-alanyl-D-alanine carboxypeptidase